MKLNETIWYFEYDVKSMDRVLIWSFTVYQIWSSWYFTVILIVYLCENQLEKKR